MLGLSFLERELSSCPPLGGAARCSGAERRGVPRHREGLVGAAEPGCSPATEGRESNPRKRESRTPQMAEGWAARTCALSPARSNEVRSELLCFFFFFPSLSSSCDVLLTLIRDPSPLGANDND